MWLFLLYGFRPLQFSSDEFKENPFLRGRKNVFVLYHDVLRRFVVVYFRFFKPLCLTFTSTVTQESNKTNKGDEDRLCSSCV